MAPLAVLAFGFLPLPPQLDLPRAGQVAVVAAAVRHASPLLCDPQPAGEDWRDLRARLVAREKAEQLTSGDEQTGADSSSAPAQMYECPLIEQGSVILGGTKQEFGFALRQQYFHKTVMLLLQHDDAFTKGIILNRPSALELDGWRVWFGGDVAEGGFFRGIADGEKEIVCLHSLSSDAAARLSLPVIRGVSQTSLEGAKALVEAGDAAKSDFWLFVGYAGWAPKQLQGEVERDSWYLAAADSSILLRELLTQGTELPAPSSEELGASGDGLQTWERLMLSIGKSEEVERTRGNFEDRMLQAWIGSFLLPQPPAPSREVQLPDQLEGTVLRSGRDATRFALSEQYMHKALLVVLHESQGVAETSSQSVSQGVVVAAVLNRATANTVQFNLPEKPRRRISFGGEAKLRALGVDDNGLLWLHRKAAYGGVAIGESGLYRIAATDAAKLVMEGEGSLSDFLILSGALAWPRKTFEELVAARDFEVVPQPQPLWPGVFELPSAGTEASDTLELSDGTVQWWLATQLSASGGSAAQGEDTDMPTLQYVPPDALADDALTQWLKFFAGHSDPDAELQAE